LGEGWGEGRDLFGAFTHLTLSLSFQERGPEHPARSVDVAATMERRVDRRNPDADAGILASLRAA